MNIIRTYTFLLILFILHGSTNSVHGVTAQQNTTRFWNIASALQKLQRTVISYLKPKDAHSKQIAIVRTNKELAPEETIFVSERKAKVRSFLQQELSKRYGDEYCSLAEDEIPTIGICFSGGGFRAMFATLGYLQGLNELGVLQSATYVAGLSGSTWALAPWLLAQQDRVEDFIQDFLPKVTTPVNEIENRDNEMREILRRAFVTNSKQDLFRFLKKIITKRLYGQSVALVDYFAFTLSNPLLRGYQSKRFFQHKFSDLQKIVNHGTYPLPIFVCNERPIDGATWFEFTPYEFGSQNYQAYVPVWSFGRKFKHGHSVDTDPEQSLSYILGICGSGFAYSVMSILPEIIHKTTSWLSYLLKLGQFRIIVDLLTYIDWFKQTTVFGQTISEWEQYKFGAARIANPSYRLSGSPYARDKTLHLSDGGHAVFTVENQKVICHSFASVPLLNPQRKLDIIIMCDADRHGVQGEHLRASVLYAEQHKHLLKQFPTINYEQLNQPVVSCFQDNNDPTNPIILAAACIPDSSYHPYVPSQHEYTNTLNFAWLRHEATLHSGLAQHIIKKAESQEIIWNSIKSWIDAKRIKAPLRPSSTQTAPKPTNRIHRKLLIKKK